MIGTATTRAHPADTSPGERLWEDAAYTLPPRRTFPACHVAADALQQCEVDLEAGQLLTPARREQREERQRLTVDEQAVKDRAARREERLQAEWDQHKRQEQERRDAEIAAAEEREQIPLREQFPPLFRPQEPPPAVKPPWWKPWQRRT